MIDNQRAYSFVFGDPLEGTPSCSWKPRRKVRHRSDNSDDATGSHGQVGNPLVNEHRVLRLSSVGKETSKS